MDSHLQSLIERYVALGFWVNYAALPTNRRIQEESRLLVSNLVANLAAPPCDFAALIRGARGKLKGRDLLAGLTFSAANQPSL
jgi:hypothetical protein